MPAVALSDHQSDSDLPQQALMDSVLEVTKRGPGKAGYMCAAFEEVRKCIEEVH